jgi:cell division septal protein FtsQ
LPHDWEQAPPTSQGVSSAPGISAQGSAKYARSVRRKRRAVLWVICAIVLLASLLLVLWYSAAPGLFSL